MPARRIRAPRPRLVRLVVLFATLIAVGAFAPASSLAATTGINVQLPPGHQIRGTVTDPGGAPVPGAHVDVTNAGETQFFTAIADTQGRYVVHALLDDDYVVFATVEDDAFPGTYYGVPDSTTNRDEATLVTIAGADAPGVDIRFVDAGQASPAAISGTIRDPDGNPVANIEVLANGEVGGTAHTAADGTWRIGRLVPGDYTVFIQPPDGSPFLYGWIVDDHVGAPDEDGTVFTLDDGELTGVDAVLTRGRTIRGHVTVARPATVEIGASGPGFASAIVDATGAFEINGLIPGSYDLLVRDAIPGPEQTETGNFPYGYVGTGNRVVPFDQRLSFDATAGDLDVGTIAVPRGTDIVGRVTDGKNGLAHSYLFVCDVGGNIGCATATGRADGSFRVVHVPSGQFTIFVSVPGRVIGYYQQNGFTVDQSAAGTVKVVSGKPDVTGVKVAVPAGGSVSGRITGPGGLPVAGAAVSAGPSGIPPNFVQPVTDANGRYTITGLATNQYDLFVRPPAGSDLVSGYYRAGAPGRFTPDFGQATVFRVIEDHDHDAPVITFRDPAPNAVDVFPQTTLEVRFSEPVDRATASSVMLRDPQGRSVPITVSFEPTIRTLSVTPNEPLLAGTRYRLSLSNAIVDWSGNHFGGASWGFTTST